MEFKKLEIEQDTGWFKKTIKNKHTIRTIIFIVAGALAGLLYFYFTEGKHLDLITSRDILKSILIGGFFGFFITNSPCARNKC